MTRKSDAPRPRDKAQRKRRRALDAYARLQRAATLTATAADAAIASFGLSASQLGVLETLDARGPLHQQELARALGRSKAQMTAIIDALEKRGFAVRERHPTDRRFTTVHLTEHGSALLSEAMPVRADAVAAIMGVLSGDQRTRLGRLCRRLVKSLAPEEDARDSDDDDEQAEAAEHEPAEASETSSARHAETVDEAAPAHDAAGMRGE
jgi:MarR family transcriptional regulator, 2-MHQ and catechol-resistance regulon repressor